MTKNLYTLHCKGTNGSTAKLQVRPGTRLFDVAHLITYLLKVATLERVDLYEKRPDDRRARKLKTYVH